MSPSPKRHLVCAALLGGAIALTTGCSATGMSEITADTKCSDYIKRPGDERHDAAVRISSEIEGVDNPGNPMWGLSLDSACGGHPDLTLGEYFRPG